jgi:hypothetical protein
MAVPFSENFTDWQPSKIERLTNYGVHERLNLRSVKLFTDGVFDFSLAANSHTLVQALLVLGEPRLLRHTATSRIRAASCAAHLKP